MTLRIVKTIALLFLLALSFGAGTATGNPQEDPVEVGKPSVLVFGLGERCRYCVELKKDIDLVTKKTGDDVLFRDIIVDQDRSMVFQYRILMSPTLIFLDATGNEVYRYQGLMDSQQILERLVELELWSQKG